MIIAQLSRDVDSCYATRYMYAKWSENRADYQGPQYAPTKSCVFMLIYGDRSQLLRNVIGDRLSVITCAGNRAIVIDL
jgi:hypothetical protein